MRLSTMLLLIPAIACTQASSPASGVSSAPASSVSSAPSTSAPTTLTPGVPPAPAASPTGTCALELHSGDGWVERSRVPCPPDGTARFLLAGDVGLPTETLGMTLQASAAVCAQKGCDLGLLPGDLLYDDGIRAAKYWELIWDKGFAQLGFPFAAVLGNHEYRHEPNPQLKRQAILAADGRKGLVSPGPSYALRLVGPDGTPIVAVAGVDTDSVSVPLSPPPTPEDMPGLGDEALANACATGAPVVWLGHHPPSSQGLHHTHEAKVESALRTRLIELGAGGCQVAVAVAGHDHDLQAYGPGCEEAGAPGVVVAGPSARGFRPAGPSHLTPCPAAKDAVTAAHFGPKQTGGFAWFSVTREGSGGRVEVSLVEATATEAKTLSSHTWTF